MVFNTIDEYIKANGMIREIPADKLAEDLIETGNVSYKKAREFFRELLNYRRDYEVFDAATKVETTEDAIKGNITLFEDCAHKIINNAIVFDDMTCMPFMDKDMIQEFKWSAESAVEEEWCIGALNVLIDNGYDSDWLFRDKFWGMTDRDKRLEEVGKMGKRHTCESIIDKKHKIEQLSDKIKVEYLSSLTRGELQSFLDDEKLFGCHFALIGLEREPLFSIDDEIVNEYFENPIYGPLLVDLRSSFDYIAKDKLFKVHDQYTDTELNELIFDEMATNDFRIKNLIQILDEPNLAQRNKWLREIKRMPLTDDEKILAIRGEYSTPNLYINKILNDLETQTRREFYESIGINYDEFTINENIPNRINYGIEIEENGAEYFYNTRGFQGHSDYSISNYSKRSHEFDDKVSGEYVSDVFGTDSIENMKMLRKQSDLLNLYGATTNTSCGFHIHCSDETIQNTDIERLALKNYSNYKQYIEDAKENDETLFYYGINEEFKDMQRIIAKKLHVFSERTDGYCEFLDENEDVPDMEKREKFVNFCSLNKHGSIEFRFLNLPDAIDPKVMEAYIDFCTCYYSYLTEENFTDDYAKEAYEEVTGKSIDEVDEDEYADLKFDILLEQLLVKDDTKKIISHMDDIFEFYNVQNENGYDYDYYTSYDKTISDENEEAGIFEAAYSILESKKSIDEEYEEAL